MLFRSLKTEIALVQLIDGKAEMEFPAAELKIEKIGKCSSCRGCSVGSLKEDEEDAVKPDAETREGAVAIAAGRSAEMENEDADL